MAIEIAGPANVCAVTGRELKPGDKFYGVLTEVAGAFVRTDIAADAWPGPPENCVAFWPGKIPAAGRSGKPTFDEEHLAGLFAQLSSAADPARVNLRYAVSLLLMRRKRLKFEDARKVNGQDVLIVRDSRSGTRYEVPDPKPTEAELAGLQDQVFAVLGWA